MIKTADIQPPDDDKSLTEQKAKQVKTAEALRDTIQKPKPE